MSHRAIATLKAGVTRALCFGVIWWGLTGDQATSWVVGVPASLAASIISLYWLPPQSLSWLGLLRLLPFFVAQSLLGGWDVAQRVCRRQLTIKPGFITYHCHLPVGLAQQCFLFISNLLPGTLVADSTPDENPLNGAYLTIHVLTQTDAVTAQLQQLEYRIGKLFCLPDVLLPEPPIPEPSSHPSDFRPDLPRHRQEDK